MAKPEETDAANNLNPAQQTLRQLWERHVQYEFSTRNTEDTLATMVEDVRARVAFYASTPTYLAAFETDGHGDTAKQLQTLARAQRWEEMPALVGDAMLDTYAVIGTHDEIAAKLMARYGGLATHLEFTMPLATPADAEKLRTLIAELKRA